VAQLLLVLVVALQSPIGRRGHDEVDGALGEPRRHAGIALNKFVGRVQTPYDGFNPPNRVAIPRERRDNIIGPSTGEKLIEQIPLVGADPLILGP
jgi:hypothetical protein